MGRVAGICAMRDVVQRLLAIIPSGKEPIAEALVECQNLTQVQKEYLHKIIKKYEFSLNLVGIKTPPPPVAHQLPSEPHFVDFVNGKYLLRLGVAHEHKIHSIPRAKYDKKSGLYIVPQRMLSVLRLHRFVKDTNLYYTEAAKEAIIWMMKEMKERYKASRAHDADLDMTGFGLALDPYQKAGIKAAARCQRSFIADAMGLGKTRQGLGVAFVLNSFPLLVICPASMPIGWEKEATQAFPDKLIVRIEKKTLPKHTCEQKQISLFDQRNWDDRCKLCRILNADMVVVNYDKLPDGWKNAYEIDEKTGKRKRIKGYKKERGERSEVELSEVAAALRARGFKAVFIDESHYIKEEGTQRTQSVLELATGSTVRLAISGTPIKNRHRELIPQLRFLDRLDDLGGRDTFCNEFCATSTPGDDKGSVDGSTLNKHLRSIGYIQRNKRDVRTELPPVRYAELWCEIDNREDYERAEEDVVNWCAEQAVLKEEFLEMIKNLDPLSASVATERKMIETRLRIMKVQALLKINILKKVAAKGKISSAIEWIKDFEMHEKKLVIFAQHRENQYALQAAFNTLHIFGKDDVVSRQKHKEIFQGEIENDTLLRDDKIVCSFGAAREGISLDAADDIFLYEPQWTSTDEDQAVARVDRHRIHNITAWRLYATNTVEEKIKMRVDGKRAVCDAMTKGEPGEEKKEDVAWSVLSDLAAMSTQKVDREAVRAVAQAMLYEPVQESDTIIQGDE